MEARECWFAVLSAKRTPSSVGFVRRMPFTCSDHGPVRILGYGRFLFPAYLDGSCAERPLSADSTDRSISHIPQVFPGAPRMGGGETLAPPGRQGRRLSTPVTSASFTFLTTAPPPRHYSLDIYLPSCLPSVCLRSFTFTLTCLISTCCCRCVCVRACLSLKRISPRESSLLTTAF